MVGDDVEHDADVALPGSGQRAVEVVERAVVGFDVEVVGDVVPVIRLRRGEARREPDGIDTQITDVVEMAADPLEVADAVAVAVGERSGVELVDHRVLPPQLVARRL